MMFNYEEYICRCGFVGKNYRGLRIHQGKSERRVCKGY